MTTGTTCPYCGVGCGLTVTSATDVTSSAPVLSGDKRHPANTGRLCVKGSALADTLGTEGRLLRPQIGGVTASWDHALNHVAHRLQETITRYGPEAVAFYVSGQLLTEDYYVANKLIKGFIGSANIDTNSRLCMSTAVAAHKRVLGSDTVPGCYEDLELADLLVIVGSNMAWTHPVIYQRIVAAKAARPQMRVVVIDPRRTVTAEFADLHLAIAGGSDAVLFEGLFAWLLEKDAIDHTFIAEHTEGFSALKAASSEAGLTLPSVAQTCNIAEGDLELFFQWFADTPRTVTLFSQGINQSVNGVSQASTILHCHLATGRIGKPGACPFSITGQPNAMGGREVGGLANQLAAHMDLENSRHRELVGRFWGSDSIPAQTGLKAIELFQAIESGDIRFVWIMATNPAVSLPDANRVRRALQTCDCVVVSDCVADNDTIRHADIVLPATGWGEKDGTVTNSERCISRQRAFLPPSGEARPDWWIISEVARRLGFESQFDYHNAAAIFREHAALSGFENQGQRDFDISAMATLTDSQYDDLAPVQWPLPTGASAGQARMFTDGRFFTASGRACFAHVQRLDPARPGGDYPYLLNTGRIRDQWHTMTRTGLSATLLRHIAEPFVEMHTDDMNREGLGDGDLVRVSSNLGQCVIKARPNPGQEPGSVFMPIHWSDSFASAACVGDLIADTRDALSGQPAFKQTAVGIEPLASRWHAVLISRRQLPLPVNQYWSYRMIAGWHLTQLSGNEPVTLSTLKNLWTTDGQQWAEMVDETSDDMRLLAYLNNAVDLWFVSQQTTPQIDESWLLDGLTNARLSARELAAGEPSGQPQRGPVICSCHQVHEATINGAISQNCNTVESVGRKTRAGTNCGSCIPEIRKLLAVNTSAPALENIC